MTKEEIIKLVLEIATPVVTSILLYFAHRLIKVFEDKTKTDVLSKNSEKIDKAIQDAVHFVAEKYRKEGGNQITGDKKLQDAVDFVKSQLEVNKIQPVPEPTLRGMVRSKVNQIRANKII